MQNPVRVCDVCYRKVKSGAPIVKYVLIVLLYCNVSVCLCVVNIYILNSDGQYWYFAVRFKYHIITIIVQ